MQIHGTHSFGALVIIRITACKNSKSQVPTQSLTFNNFNGLCEVQAKN